MHIRSAKHGKMLARCAKPREHLGGTVAETHSYGLERRHFLVAFWVLTFCEESYRVLALTISIMQKNLLVLPLDTALEHKELEKLCQPALSAFDGAYSEIRIFSQNSVKDLVSPDAYACDVFLGTRNMINGIPDQGVHRDIGQVLHSMRRHRFGSQIRHGLIVTDKMISVRGLRAGGTADRINGTALVTTLEARCVTNTEDLKRIIGRTRSVIIHELGHLFGLKHHNAVVDNKYCPMVNRGWNDPEFKDEDSRAAYFDVRGEVLCVECRDKIKAFLNG